MSSKTEIANLALQLIGQAPDIVNVDTDNTTRAKEVRQAWDAARLAALRAHAWNFATVRTTLAAMSTAPEWGYAKKYALPPEYVGSLRFSKDNHGAQKPPHRILTDRAAGGRELHTDEGSPVYIEFVSNVADEGLFDPMFVEYLAAKLAEKIGYRLTGRATIGQEMREYAKDLARDARWADAVDTGRDEADQGEFLDARAIP